MSQIAMVTHNGWKQPSGQSMRGKLDRDYKRFMLNVYKQPAENGCWIFRCVTFGQHGQFGMGGSTWTAHRASWFFHCGSIPDGAWVLHRCNNRPCVRPDHLYLGDAKQNAVDTAEARKLAGQWAPYREEMERYVEEMREAWLNAPPEAIRTCAQHLLVEELRTCTSFDQFLQRSRVNLRSAGRRPERAFLTR